MTQPLPEITSPMKVDSSSDSIPLERDPATVLLDRMILANNSEPVGLADDELGLLLGKGQELFPEAQPMESIFLMREERREQLIDWMFGKDSAETIAEDKQDSPEMIKAQEALEESRNEYAKLIAERSKRSFSRRYSKVTVEAAGDDYEAAKEALLRQMTQELELEERTEEEKDQIAKIAAINEITALTQAIYEQKASSGNKFTQAFLNKWASWGDHKLLSKAGVSGQIKKTVTMSGVGIAAGLASSVVLAPLAGAVAGGAAGLGAAMFIGRRLFSGRVNRSAEALTVGEAQAETQRERLVEKLHENNGNLSSGEVTHYLNQHTEQVVRRNRRRDVGSLVLGAVVGELAHNLVDKGYSWQYPFRGGDQVLPESDNHQPNSDPDSYPRFGMDSDGLLPVVPAPEYIPDGSGSLDYSYEPYEVKEGEGITHAIRAFAEGNGYHLSPDQYFEIFQEHEDAFAKLERVAPMNVQGGLGIAAPGSFDIPPELLEEIYKDIKLTAA